MENPKDQEYFDFFGLDNIKSNNKEENPDSQFPEIHFPNTEEILDWIVENIRSILSNPTIAIEHLTKITDNIIYEILFHKFKNVIDKQQALNILDNLVSIINPNIQNKIEEYFSDPKLGEINYQNILTELYVKIGNKIATSKDLFDVYIYRGYEYYFNIQKALAEENSNVVGVFNKYLGGSYIKIMDSYLSSIKRVQEYVTSLNINELLEKSVTSQLFIQNIENIVNDVIVAVVNKYTDLQANNQNIDLLPLFKLSSIVKDPEIARIDDMLNTIHIKSIDPEIYKFVQMVFVQAPTKVSGILSYQLSLKAMKKFKENLYSEEYLQKLVIPKLSDLFIARYRFRQAIQTGDFEQVLKFLNINIYNKSRNPVLFNIIREFCNIKHKQLIDKNRMQNGDWPTYAGETR
jgi:hypothetical protein